MLTEPLLPSTEPRLRSINSSLRKGKQRRTAIHPWGRPLSSHMRRRSDNCLFRCQIAMTTNTQNVCLFKGCPGCDLLWKLGRHWGDVVFGTRSLKRVFISTNGCAQGVYYLSVRIYIKAQWFILTHQVLCVVHLGCRASWVWAWKSSEWPFGCIFD